MIDKSFLQRLLECRSGGGSSPTTIATKWITNESKHRANIKCIVSFIEDNTDDTDNNNTKDRRNATRICTPCRARRIPSSKVQANNGNTTVFTIDFNLYFKFVIVYIYIHIKTRFVPLYQCYSSLLYIYCNTVGRYNFVCRHLDPIIL